MNSEIIIISLIFSTRNNEKQGAHMQTSASSCNHHDTLELNHITRAVAAKDSFHPTTGLL